MPLTPPRAVRCHSVADEFLPVQAGVPLLRERDTGSTLTRHASSIAPGYYLYRSSAWRLRATTPGVRLGTAGVSRLARRTRTSTSASGRSSTGARSSVPMPVERSPASPANSMLQLEVAGLRWTQASPPADDLRLRTRCRPHASASRRRSLRAGGSAPTERSICSSLLSAAAVGRRRSAVSEAPTSAVLHSAVDSAQPDHRRASTGRSRTATTSTDRIASRSLTRHRMCGSAHRGCRTGESPATTTSARRSIYRGNALSIDVPISRAAGGASELPTRSGATRGCADAGLCYPPDPEHVTIHTCYPGPAGGRSPRPLHGRQA